MGELNANILVLFDIICTLKHIKGKRSIQFAKKIVGICILHIGNYEFSCLVVFVGFIIVFYKGRVSFQNIGCWMYVLKFCVLYWVFKETRI